MASNNKAAPDKKTARTAIECLHSISNYTLGEAAVVYTEAGLAVLPLQPERKEPYGRLVKHGVKDATSDPTRATRWWAVEPKANIGIRTGQGLVVVDVDPRNGGELDPTWPETLTARTASGGWHLYYRVDGEVRTSHSAIAPGVDVKANGGYVVAPPSVRGDDRWAWETVVPMATASVSAFQGQAGEAKVRANRSLARYRERGSFVPLDVIREGQRHSELTRWAGWLRGQGYRRLEIAEVLSVINATACVSPVPEDEVDAIARWAGELPS